jgi:hypothetical protein
MSKAIKLQDDAYWDSSSVVHNKESLKDILNNTAQDITNINNQINNINTATKSIITATISDNYTISATSTYEKLPLTESSKIGNKLSISNGNIIIGSGVSFIKASFCVHYQTIASAGNKWATLYKNEDKETQTSTYASDRVTVSSPTVLISVTAGDKISLRVQGTKNDVVRGLLYSPVTVEVVE